jgi:TolB protein
VTALAAVLLAFAVTTAHAAFPGKNGKIAYNTLWVGPHAFFTPPDIYTVDPTGGDPLRLTTDESSSGATWSPDGKRIAFSSGRDSTSYRNDIYTMNADGTDVVRLTTDPATDHQPAWSPDGKKIAFVSFRNEPNLSDCDSSPDGCNWELYVVNSDGSGETRLTDSPGQDTEPSWSPDSKRIAFSSERDGNFEIYAMNVDGTGITRLTNDGRKDSSPQWSPLGGEIAFVREEPPVSYFDPVPHVYVMSIDGSGVRRLIDSGPYYEKEPAWSPDGHRIAFVAFVFQEQIHVANSAGSGHIALTDDQSPDPNYLDYGIYNRDPTWSPDGVQIAFTHTDCPYYCDYSKLQVVNADGGGGRTTVATNAAQQPDWQPLPGPQRSDYRNASHYCKALREFLGDEAFRNRYGGGANAHGKCVSSDRR